MLAVQFSQPSLVRFLLANGVDSNASDEAPIFLYEALAVWNGLGRTAASRSEPALDVLDLLAAAPGTDLEGS